MSISFQNQLTYYGTLDDVVDRYPWPHQVDLETARRQMITSAIYRKTALINDGYLVANPHLLPDLSNLTRSLMGAMLLSGNARIFARTSTTNLAEGIEKSAEHVATHRALVKSNDWSRIRRNLEKLSEDIPHRIITWPADKNMGEMFHILLCETINAPDSKIGSLTKDEYRPELERTYDRYVQMTPPPYETARGNWERAAWIAIAGYEVNPWEIAKLRSVPRKEKAHPEYERVRVMMNFANEVYHLAYAAAANWSVRTDDREKVRALEVGVATAFFGDAFDCAVIDEAEDEKDRFIRERIDGLLITVPRNLQFKENFTFVGEFVRDETTEEIGDKYLSALSKFVSDGVGEQEVLKLRAEYAHALARIMAPHVHRGIAGKAAESLAGKLLGMPVDAVDWGLSAAGWLIGLGKDQFNTPMVERMRRTRVAAQLQEQANFGQQFINDGRLARELGFYLGPLEQQSMNRLAEKAKPYPSN